MTTEKEKLLDNLNILELYSNGSTIKSLHRKFNISERLISNYLTLKGVKIRKSCEMITYNINDVIEMYKNGKALKEIGEVVGASRQSLSRRLKKERVCVIRKDIMININENIFDNIDSEEKAYWLGFLFADGNISQKNYYVSVNLSIKDKSHLEKLRKFLNYERELITCFTKQGYGVVRLRVSNKHLWSTLNSIGCIPAKSLTLKFPFDIFNKKNDLIRHFIRGYFDGDGCLTYRDKLHKRPEVNVIGTEDFLRGMEHFLPVNPMKNLRIKHKENGKIFVWEKDSRVAFKVANFLYKDANIFLERKYNKYLEYCRLYEKL